MTFRRRSIFAALFGATAADAVAAPELARDRPEDPSGYLLLLCHPGKINPWNRGGLVEAFANSPLSVYGPPVILEEGMTVEGMERVERAYVVSHPGQISPGACRALTALLGPRIGVRLIFLEEGMQLYKIRRDHLR